MGIPVDVYEALEDALGKEPARKLVHGLEAAIEAITTVKLAQLRDELLDKLVTKEVFLAHMESLRAYIDQQVAGLQARVDALQARMEQEVTGLQARIEREVAGLHARIEREVADLRARVDALQARYDTLNMKLNVVLILLILLLTVMNPTFAGLVKALLGGG